MKMKGIRKNRNELKEILECGRLRQILERGYLSDTEIQHVVDAVSEKIYSKIRKR